MGLNDTICRIESAILNINGSSYIVEPDNALFEGGAGETIRLKLLNECDVHTLLRLPTGQFYANQCDETERFKRFTYDEIMQSDKESLDIFWLKDESLEDMDNLLDPEVLALEITENLESALDHFRAIYEDLEETHKS